MKRIVNILRAEMAFVFVWAAVLVTLFETGVWSAGYYAGDDMAEYVMNLTSVLTVIVFVPFALKLMNFRWVKSMFGQEDETATCRSYRRWSEVRLALLAVTLWSNISFYYLTLHNTGLMCALIAMVCFCFCVPSVDRLVYETGIKLPDTKCRTDKQGKE